MSRPLVALFGTSANPPTGEGGHQSILSWLSQAVLPEAGGRRADQIWVLPVHRHAFSEKAEMVSFPHRMAMARLAFAGIERVRVLPIEAELSRSTEKPGTIDLVERVERACPERDFVLVLGEDTWADLAAGRWRRGEQLRQRIPIVVVRRPGASGGAGRSVEGVSEVSSSQARTHDLLGVPPAVADYAALHGLYAPP